MPIKKRIISVLFILNTCSISQIANAGILSVNLLKAGPTSAVVEYNNQKIIVTKYHAPKGTPLSKGR
jgi:hypothetical protein